ncbi:MAG: TRAP transporter small permease subunit [Thermus sp.]|uniref:TRAP transporter small permease n=1 Tax=Thermus sp. TaxID=275 RepID=UPI0025E576C7|nr:TRAP transporter small permease subunit [Thermus sp.]MCS6867762.1 TRAP transporter small permease subunit [Thermus sp.]MCS7219532.1 TRAP transporter small permease subunit [Thermus sp.]MDW8357907.1 TRAP transporter small permease subunit [Thermus sp.]
MLRRLEETLLAFLLGGMASLAFANVLARYLFRYPLAFTEELLVNAFIWATLLGIAVGLREGAEGAHIRFVALTEFLPAPWRRASIAFGFLAFGLLFGVLAYLAWRQALEDLALGTISPALGVPNALYTLPTPFLSLLVAWRGLEGALRALRG